VNADACLALVTDRGELLILEIWDRQHHREFIPAQFLASG